MTTALAVIRLLAMLLPAITEVMQAVEQIFGPRTGVDKKEVVTAVVNSALASELNKLPEGSKPLFNAVLSSVIDAHVAALKDTGAL